MTAWSNYESRAAVHGTTRRKTALRREIHDLNKRLPDSLSYHSVEIFDCYHGYNIDDRMVQSKWMSEQNVAIINSDNLNEKYIFSLPGEDIQDGSLVHWMDNYWLVTERDANTTVYTRAKLLQCNFLLKWVSGDSKEIIRQWCVVEDGTKYLTGEYEDRNFIVARGDSRIAITIARNLETAKLGRRNRFLIDDEYAPVKLAYTLSKPLKFTGVYNKEGVFKWVLQEVQTTVDDNQDLMIADYYKYFPKEDGNDDDGGDTGGKKVWL